MLADYTGVLLIIVIGVLVASGMLGAHLLIGPRRRFPSKLEPFECGEKQLVSPHRRFSVKFYLVAMLFIVFDVEAIFIYPWAAAFRTLGWLGFFEMLTFIGILVVGLAYVWLKGALEW